MNVNPVFLLSLSFIFRLCDASNILLIALDPAKSHASIFSPIIKGVRGRTVDLESVLMVEIFSC